MWKTPQEIVKLQNFGWGDFTDEELCDKALKVKECMAMRPKISAQPAMSVVVAAYREENYILGTLFSLAMQTHRDVEFIIVSNGEPYGNDTQQIAEQSGFTVIHEREKGWARAHQIGLEAAAGTIVASTDADTLHFSDWLTIADQLFEQTGYIAASGPVQFLELQVHKKIYKIFTDVYKRLFERNRTGRLRLTYGANSFFLRESLLACDGYRDLDRGTYSDSAVLHKILPRGGEVYIQHPRSLVFSSGRRINNTPIIKLVSKALRARIFGVHSIIQS